MRVTGSGEGQGRRRGALTRVAGALALALLACAGCLAGSARAAAQWQTLTPSAVVPDRSEISSAAFDHAGRAVVTVRDPSGFAAYERSAGQTSLVRRAIAGEATGQGTAVLDAAGRTVVVWVDDSAVHARTRSGDGDFGPVVDLPGSAVYPEVDAAALSDGSVVVAQSSSSDTQMRIWRRAANSTAFTLVSDAAVPSAERTTWDAPVVRAGPNGAAVVVFTTYTPVFGFGTMTRRGRVFMLSGTTVSPLETAFAWEFEFTLFTGGVNFDTRSTTRRSWTTGPSSRRRGCSSIERPSGAVRCSWHDGRRRASGPGPAVSTASSGPPRTGTRTQVPWGPSTWCRPAPARSRSTAAGSPRSPGRPRRR
jgi:hypothetical protein